jgi:hypothetical protein
MSTYAVQGSFLYRNLANATSILGVLPLVILLLDGGYKYVVPLIIFNNFMDDLDGGLAHADRYAGDCGRVYRLLPIRLGRRS